jgi:hypothetical protein
MKCDPRVVSLKGIQSEHGTVEDGNHLRVFVGTDHGFFEDSLTVYRRPHVDKLARLLFFKVPIKKKGFLPTRPNGWQRKKFYITIETNHPSLTLSGRLSVVESENSFTLEISFPELVGYLEMQAHRSFRLPGLTKTLGDAQDKIYGSDVFVLSEKGKLSEEGSRYKRQASLILRNRARTGLREGWVARFLSRLSDYTTVRALGKLISGIGVLLWPRSELEVLALYDSEFVAAERADSYGRLSLINVPLNEIRITAPLDYGFEVDFLLMEEDSVKGGWTKVETLPGPRTLLTTADEDGTSHVFENLLRTRFWPDVKNRLLKRGQAGNQAGRPAISELYGAENFDELIALVSETYKAQGWIQRLILGPRLGGLYREYKSAYVVRDYDPDQLALLLTLTLDVNIATLLGLHTVDRGQHSDLPEKTLDTEVLKKYLAANWRRKFDYKVEGKWPHLMNTYAYVYYDLHKDTSLAVSGKAIEDSQTLSGIEVSSGEDGNPNRLYKVGLRWDIKQHHRGAIEIAYDVFRNGHQLTFEKPITPARDQIRPTTMEMHGQTIPFHRSLPAIPPFSEPQEVVPAEFQYVDTEARFGTATYDVESVDIHGRYSVDRKSRSHQVEGIVPIPVPNDLRAEVKKLDDGTYDVVTRWDWPNGHRELAPDWVRFEVFFHDGPHRVGLKGSILWIEKDTSAGPNHSFTIEAFVDTANFPVPLSDLSNIADGLLLRAAGRSYYISDINSRAGPRAGVDIVSCGLEAKRRKGSATPPAMPDGTRGLLMISSADELLRIPFFISGTVEPEALMGEVAAQPVQILISRTNSMLCSPGDPIRVLLRDILLAGYIVDLETSAAARSIDGVGVLGVTILFEPGWAEYHLPMPTSSCSWLKSDGSGLVDWDNSNNWPVGPVNLDRPVEYPLHSSNTPQDNFPISISETPAPAVKWVNDKNGQPNTMLSSIVLPTDDLVAASDSLLTGCQLTVDDFSQVVRQNLKGEGSQIVTTIPENFNQQDADTVLAGKQAQINRLGSSYQGFCNERIDEAGQTRIEVTFDEPLPLMEWRLCALRAPAEAMPQDEDPDRELPPEPSGFYYFQIVNWSRVSKDGKHYSFVVANLMLSGQGVVDEVQERIEFEVVPKIGNVDIIVPGLYSATFELTGISSADFYRKIDGGEISYRVIRDKNQHEPDFDPDNPTETVELFSTAAAMSREPQGVDQLDVAFFPVLNTFDGFIPPPDVPVALYPSFRLDYSPQFLDEQSLRNNVPTYVTVRAIAEESGHEFTGPFAPVVMAPLARGRLELSPPPLPPAQPVPVQEPVYAQPGPSGFTYTLSWVWDAYEFKVYRISADFVDSVRVAGESDRDVLNDYSRMEAGLNLRNRSQLLQSNFTDVFESRGGGRFYYKVVALDKTGVPRNLADRWYGSLILPDPELQGPVIVLDTATPDTPTPKPPKVINGKVELEWQTDPSVDEYWIYRDPEFVPENPIKLTVSDIDDSATQPSLKKVPIVAGTESEPIRCKGSAQPSLSLFWMPDMYQMIGLYQAEEYEEWIAGDRSTVPNLYPGSTGEVVRLKHRDGSEEDIRLDVSLVWGDPERTQPGPRLTVEYLTEHTVRLDGLFTVENQEILVRRSPDIAVLVGIYKIEDFDPDNPQNPLSGTLDLTGYPVINDIRDGAAIVEDGYRPVIIYKKVDDPNEPSFTIYGAYPVRDGAIKLLSSPKLPLVEGQSAAGLVAVPAAYNQPGHLIASVYRQSDYNADPATAQNLYNNSFDGAKISGINLPDGDPVVILARQLQVNCSNRLYYQSLRIEGYSQAFKVDTVTLADKQSGTLVPIAFDDLAFDQANPDVLRLASGSVPQPPPPAEVIVQYTDDGGIQRSVTVIADSDNLAVVADRDHLNIGRSAYRPAGLAPHIKDLLGVWRLPEYNSSNPDDNFELVVKLGNQMFHRHGSFLQVHADAGLPVRENGEPVPLAIRFRDHKDNVRSVTSKPGWLRFTDESPSLNTTTRYQMKAVKIRDLLEEAQPKRLEIGSRLSEPHEVTLMDPTPPVPPELSYEGLDGGLPVFSWLVVEGVLEYQLERRAYGSPVWMAIDDVLRPLPEETIMTHMDASAQSGEVYDYRLRIRGVNGKPNVEFRVFSGVEIS